MKHCDGGVANDKQGRCAGAASRATRSSLFAGEAAIISLTKVLTAIDSRDRDEGDLSAEYADYADKVSFNKHLPSSH